MGVRGLGTIGAMSHHPFPWREPLLAYLRTDPFVTKAADALGVDRSTVFRARQADPEFGKAVLDALAEGQAVVAERVEQEVLRRGIEGFYEPVVHQGRISYAHERYIDADGKDAYRPVMDANGQHVPLTVRKVSDTLLLAAAKARIAAYRVERTEITGADGAALQIDETARRARVQAILAEAKARRRAEDFG